MKIDDKDERMDNCEDEALLKEAASRLKKNLPAIDFEEVKRQLDIDD